MRHPQSGLVRAVRFLVDTFASRVIVASSDGGAVPRRRRETMVTSSVHSGPVNVSVRQVPAYYIESEALLEQFNLELAVYGAQVVEATATFTDGATFKIVYVYDRAWSKLVLDNGESILREDPYITDPDGSADDHVRSHVGLWDRRTWEQYGKRACRG